MTPLLTKVPQPLRRLFWSAYGRSVWDAEHRGPASPLVHQIVDLVGQEQRRGARVLDAGCGTGVYAYALAKQGCKVTAIDTAPGMLIHARQRAKMLPAGCRGSLTVDDVSVDGPLPFPNGSFEVALLVSVLQAVNRPEYTLREIHRALAPKGTLYIVYFLPHPNKTLSLHDELTTRAKTLRTERRVTRVWQLALMALKSSAERQQLTHQWTPKELLTLVADAGYTAHVSQTQHWMIVKAHREAPFETRAGRPR
jgi:ubiquinone/menaquinone biosynthesis C-methylase UbiE